MMQTYFEYTIGKQGRCRKIEACNPLEVEIHTHCLAQNTHHFNAHYEAPRCQYRFAILQNPLAVSVSPIMPACSGQQCALNEALLQTHDTPRVATSHSPVCVCEYEASRVQGHMQGNLKI